jgi:5-methylcytosine-specific restriction protein B
VGIYYPGLLEKLKSYHGTTEKNVRKNYVIIIDEINRGNVSQIFGELITLIEKDKRMGNPEEISVKLAYSKEDFCVPPNLYILGTMNTADRSVEALDTALRRRFEFKEMMPDPEIIQAVFEKEYLSLCAERDDLLWEDKEWIALEQPYLDVITRNSDNTQFEKFKNEINKKKKPRDFNEYKYSWDNAEVKLVTVKVLETINKRIEILLNRDHQIGHSYFIGKYTRKEIYQTFYQNIIPLLQEYFYGDYGKVGLVLGPDFVEIIKDEGTSLLADFEYSDAGDFDQKIIYRINAFPGNRDTPDYDIFYEAFCAIA